MNPASSHQCRAGVGFHLLRVGRRVRAEARARRSAPRLVARGNCVRTRTGSCHHRHRVVRTRQVRFQRPGEPDSYERTRVVRNHQRPDVTVPPTAAAQARHAARNCVLPSRYRCLRKWYTDERRGFENGADRNTRTACLDRSDRRGRHPDALGKLMHSPPAPNPCRANCRCQDLNSF